MQQVDVPDALATHSLWNGAALVDLEWACPGIRVRVLRFDAESVNIEVPGGDDPRPECRVIRSDPKPSASLRFIAG